LRTRWISTFREDETSRILKIPEKVRVVAMTVLGYPDEPPWKKSRKGLDQIDCFEKYG